MQVSEFTTCQPCHVHSSVIASFRLLSESGGVEALVQLLSDSEAECRQFAADCITSMAPDGMYHQCLSPSLPNCLLASLTHVLPFLSLPPLESLRSELITAGAVPSLVSSLSFPLSSVQTSIAEALSMLACDTTARDQVGGRRERERARG